MTLERVAEGVDRWIMPEAAMNAYVISSAGEALVVDPGTLPSRAAALREEIEARGDRVVGVVVTHAHWDHFLAIEAFAGVPSFAHPAAIEHIHAHPDEHRAAAVASLHEGTEQGTEAELWRMQVPAPSVPIEREHVLLVGDQRVTLEPLDTAHTAGDLLVHVDPVDVTITGDVVEVGADPQWDAESDLRGWLSVLTHLRVHGRTTLLPGHGDPADGSRLEHHRQLFDAQLASPELPEGDTAD